MYYVQRIVLSDGLVSFPCPIGGVLVQVQALAKLQVFSVVNVFVVHSTDGYTHGESVYYEEFTTRKPANLQWRTQQLHCPTDYGNFDEQHITIGTHRQKLTDTSKKCALFFYYYYEIRMRHERQQFSGDDNKAKRNATQNCHIQTTGATLLRTRRLRY